MLSDSSGKVGGDKVGVGGVRVVVLVVLGNDRDRVLVIRVVLVAVDSVLKKFERLLTNGIAPSFTLNHFKFR